MGVTHLLSRYPSFSDVGGVRDKSETFVRSFYFMFILEFVLLVASLLIV